MKASPAQISILQQMRQGITLHSHTVEGNVAPLYPTQSAWMQDYRSYRGIGMKSIQMRTLEALLRLDLIEEEKRYKSATSEQGAYKWDTWTINYRLTQKGCELVAFIAVQVVNR